MPELPEVETVSRMLEALGVGRTIRAVHAKERVVEVDGERIAYGLLISSAPLNVLASLCAGVPFPFGVSVFAVAKKK